MDNMNMIKQKENEYGKYISEHIKNVKKAWNEFKEKCSDILEYPAQVELIDSLIENHDMSKYSSYEFDAYRRYFYPINDKEKAESEEDFNIAWKHHYENNPHHWNHWAVTDKDSMPFVYVVEMICDWQAMGYKFGNTAKEYYESKKDEIILGDKQRKWVETILNLLSN